MKLAISVLFAVLVTTVICFSVKAQEPATPQDLLLELKEIVKTLMTGFSKDT